MTVGLHLTACLVFQMDVCKFFQETEVYLYPSQTSKTELFVKIWRKWTSGLRSFEQTGCFPNQTQTGTRDSW